MGSVFCSLGSLFSVALDALERISLCTICAMLICCLTITVLVVLLVGIGIGYHYSFVNHGGGFNKTQHEKFFLHSINKVFKQNLHRIIRRDAEGVRIAKLTKTSVAQTPSSIFNFTKSYFVL